MKVANDNAKVWFGEMKRLLEQDDTESFLDGVCSVSTAKNAAKNKKLIRTIY